jgi:hypothetical protein
VQRFLTAVFRSPRAVPPELRDVCRHVKAEVYAKFPEATSKAIGALLFVRFFNAALTVPEAYGLVKDAPPRSIRRTLVLVTKIMAALASDELFGKKEEFMMQFNELVGDNRMQMQAYYDAITANAAAATSDLKPVEVPSAIAESSLTFVASKAKQLLSMSDTTVLPSTEAQALVS